MSDIPLNHPRYKSLVTRKRLADYALAGVVSMEGLTSHGRGEAFDYLVGEKTLKTALEAEKLAACVFLAASHPVFSVNGNTAILATEEIAELQKVTNCEVEINLFHRTEERIEKIITILEKAGVIVSCGPVERCIPLPHDRGLCRPNGIGSADVILVPLEDGDRCEALVAMGKIVITIDLNPLDRTSKTATIPIIDEVTRALPNITAECRRIKTTGKIPKMPASFDGDYYLKGAVDAILENLAHALD
ncbi:MAG: phosphopantothenate/pantothenate synthetase [Methanocalculaceae archaeon]|jgi:4-phosphopantoate--beta-alanine ligase|nr:phosphopantothenate/pantothenate synthetase [Methanocalculaceae archaeon]